MSQKLKTQFNEKLNFFFDSDLDKQQMVDALMGDIDQLVAEVKESRQTICIKTVNRIKARIKAAVFHDDGTQDDNDDQEKPVVETREAPLKTAEVEPTSNKTKPEVVAEKTNSHGLTTPQ